MIASRPGSGRPCAGTDCVVMCRRLLGRICPHQFDKTAHRNVRLARRLTFRRVALSYCSEEQTTTTRHTSTSSGGTVTTPTAATPFTDPAPAERLERAAAALTAHGFTVEILDDAATARRRIKDLIPEGANVFTGASETLRLSGIDDDINTSGRYQAVKPRVLAMDRATRADDIRRLLA